MHTLKELELCQFSTTITHNYHFFHTILSSLINEIHNIIEMMSPTRYKFEIMTRITRVLLLPKGRFSSMLDMGGVSAAKGSSNPIKVDVAKNSKLRAIAFDINVLANYSKDSYSSSLATTNRNEIPREDPALLTSPSLSDNSINMVQNLADLLKVKLGGGYDDENEKSKSINQSVDDLSRLTGFDNVKKIKRQSAVDDENNTTTEKYHTKAPPTVNVGLKYADKLRKVGTGLDGMELVKNERQEASIKGDAHSHIAARKLMSSGKSSDNSKWVADSGVGSLLLFLSNRSMRIALLPTPAKRGDCVEKDLIHSNKMKDARQRMENLSKQLPNVNFDLLVSGMEGSADDNVSRRRKQTVAIEGEKTNDILKSGSAYNNGNSAGGIVDYVSRNIDAPPISTLVVSDRDDYLLAAKNKGMYTCRIRPKNGPRGNVSVNFQAEQICEVQDVVNEINGISFNSVLSNSSH